MYDYSQFYEFCTKDEPNAKTCSVITGSWVDSVFFDNEPYWEITNSQPHGIRLTF